MKIKYGIVPTMMGPNSREFVTTIERREPNLFEFLLIVPELHEWMGRQAKRGTIPNVYLIHESTDGKRTAEYIMDVGGLNDKLLSTKLKEGDLVMCSILWG